MTRPKTTSSHAIIIDNATLRGALIALGLLDPPYGTPHEPIKIFDGHIAAAEVLIESMLLYDHIYVPRLHEEYPAIVPLIQATVGQDLIRELPLKQTRLKALKEFAEQDFAAWPLGDHSLILRLHEFAGTKASTVSWDRWIFARYPEQVALGLTEGEWNRLVFTIADYSLRPLEVAGTQSARQSLSQFFASLGIPPNIDQVDAAVLWLTYRTCIYDCISWDTGIPYVPHPQRAALWKAVNVRRSQPVVFSQVPFDLLFDARMKVGEQVNEALGWQSCDLDIPPFFTYILQKSPTSPEVLNTVMKVRQQREVKALRTLLGTISSTLYDEGSVSRILELKKQFDDLKHDLPAQYQNTTLPKISPTIQLVSAIGVQFDLPIPQSVSRLASRLQTINKPHLAVLRDVFKVTTDIWKLSHLYDKLYQGRRILARETVMPPKGVEMRVLKPDYHPLGFARGIDSVIRIKEAVLITPLECREKLEEFLLRHPTKPCQLALIDIDDLDIYNQVSHSLGDAIIYAVTGLIRDKVGVYTIYYEGHAMNVSPISRVAGDTFIVVVLDRSSNDWLQRLRIEISFINPKELVNGEMPFPIKRISISAGLATSPVDGYSADDLFKVAYERLKEEKRHKHEEPE